MFFWLILSVKVLYHTVHVDGTQKTYTAEDVALIITSLDHDDELSVRRVPIIFKWRSNNSSRAAGDIFHTPGGLTEADNAEDIEENYFNDGGNVGAFEYSVTYGRNKMSWTVVSGKVHVPDRTPAPKGRLVYHNRYHKIHRLMERGIILLINIHILRLITDSQCSGPRRKGNANFNLPIHELEAFITSLTI